MDENNTDQLMFTYSHANTALGQSERAYYLSYFRNMYRPVYTDKKRGKVRSAKNHPSSAHNQHARSAETAICFMKS